MAASGHVSAGAANKCDEFPSPHGFARAEDYNRVSKEYHIFGSRIVICYTQADIDARLPDVRFTPKSGHHRSANECPLCAKSAQIKVAFRCQ